MVANKHCTGVASTDFVLGIQLMHSSIGSGRCEGHGKWSLTGVASTVCRQVVLL